MIGESIEVAKLRLKSWALDILSQGREISAEELQTLSHDDLALIGEILIDISNEPRCPPPAIIVTRRDLVYGGHWYGITRDGALLAQDRVNGTRGQARKAGKEHARRLGLEVK